MDVEERKHIYLENLKQNLIKYTDQFLEIIPGFAVLGDDGHMRPATPDERELLGKAKTVQEMEKIMKKLEDEE